VAYVTHTDTHTHWYLHMCTCLFIGLGDNLATLHSAKLFNLFLFWRAQFCDFPLWVCLSVVDVVVVAFVVVLVVIVTAYLTHNFYKT